MLLETKVRKIKARVVFNEKQKHDPNSSINPSMNDEVTIWLFMRSTSKDLHCRARLVLDQVASE